MFKHYLFLLFFCLIQSNIFASDVIVGNINYRLNEENKTAEVISKGNEKYSGDIIIPSSIEYDNESYRVYSIGYDSFYGCKSLTSVSLPSTILHIRDKFTGCSEFNLRVPSLEFWMNLDQEYYISSPYHLFVNDVEIKDLIIPQGTTEIRSYCFCNCQSIKNVTIPVSLETINYMSFAYTQIDEVRIESIESWLQVNCEDNPLGNAEKLIINGVETSDLVIPGNVGGIGYNAFGGCKALKSVVIEEGIEEVGRAAFWGCKNLEKVSLPKSLGIIGNNAFSACENLKDVYIEDLSRFSTIWCGDEESLTYCHLFDNAANVYVNGVKQSSLDIPEGTTWINDYVFEGLKCLDSITIPSTLTDIGLSAFENTNFKTVKIANLENYCKINHIRNGLNWFDCSLFKNADEIIIEGKRNKNIVIPSNTERIGDYAFSGLKCNVNIIIPESVTSIGTNAFYNCTNVDSLYVLSKNITYEGGTDFYLTNIKRFFVQEGSNAYQEHTRATKEVLKSTGSCGENAYYTLTNEGEMNVWGTGSIQSFEVVAGTNWRPWKNNDVTTLKINEGITVIGNNSFAYLTELREITIDGNIGVGYAGFRECGKLENLYINGKITGVDTYGFMNCKALKHIDLSKCDYIGPNAFFGCENIDKIVLMSGLYKIYYYSFCGCRNVQEIVVPESVTEIGECAFKDCTSLESLTIGKNVNMIEKGIVSGCNKLKSLYMKGYNYISGRYNPFQDYYSTCTLYLPKGGRSADVWSAEWNTYKKFTHIKENHFYENEPTSIDIAISSAEWSTLILPFDAEIPDGLNVYSCNGSEEKLLNLEKVSSIKANTPYLINGEQGTYNFSDIGSAWEDTYEGGWFTGAYVETNVPINSYILAKVNGIVGFYRVTEANVGNTKIAPYHCYLTPNNESQAKCNAFFFDETATAINNVDYNNNMLKPIKYNLYGQRVKSNAKGIVIENGKKKIIK